METFAIKNLSFTYPGRSEPAIREINMKVRDGEFLLICGKSGCGKSTLLRNLKTTIRPHGEMNGEILFRGRPLDKEGIQSQAQGIGYVLQNPDNQIVTDKVWHELAFGLENLGCNQKVIGLRVAEMASFFGIQNWFREKTTELSGGQKQILNLAAVMVMQPEALILDEPTAQLDPIAASEFLAAVKKVNREIGTTVILTEHRLDELWSMVDRVVVLEEGRVLRAGDPQSVGRELASAKHPMMEALPAPMQAYLLTNQTDENSPCPIDVRGGRHWINNVFGGRKPEKVAIGEEAYTKDKGEVKIELKDVWFRYAKEAPDVIRALSLKVYKGEMVAIMGGNGNGKSTALSVMSGLKRAYRGKVKIDGKLIEKYEKNQLFNGKLGVLPQNPQTIFVQETVRKDLYEMFKGRGVSNLKQREALEKVVQLTEISRLLENHPYDISGGEQQRVALAKILLMCPEIIFLDEPTKGMDADFKNRFAVILKDLLARGKTIVMVSHDIEFCGKHADRCALFFDGSISAIDTPRKFFAGNSFYTTSANRSSRHVFIDVVTAGDLAKIMRQTLDDDRFCGGSGNPGDNSGRSIRRDAEVSSLKSKSKEKKSGAARGLHSSVSVEVTETLSDVIPEKHRNGSFKNKSVRGNMKIKPYILHGLSLLFMTATLLAAVRFTGNKTYMVVSFLIIIYAMVPFFLSFERRKPAARELILIAVLISLGVAGRVAFFMVPQVKPVLAVAIIAGCTLGSQAGFIVGAMIAFVSNFFFGQGPWTPWQMFAMGFVGMLAGVIFSNSAMLRKKAPIIIFGFISGYIYGLIVDLWTIFSLTSEPSFKVAIGVYAVALTMNTILALSTSVFLFILVSPMIGKIERIQSKYGLLRNL